MEDFNKCVGCSCKDLSVFKNLDSERLEKVSNEKNCLHFKKKDIIFKENEKVTGFYCVTSGLVRTYKISGTNKEQTFQVASRGKWLGFRNVISGGEYDHTAICLEDVEVCFISKETITQLIKSDETFQMEVMKYLAREWKEMESKVLSMGTKQIHNRLAEILIIFHDASRDPELNINVTREVMASCVGTSTETIIRALSDFKDRNWIRIEKSKIELLNIKALYNLSESSPS